MAGHGLATGIDPLRPAVRQPVAVPEDVDDISWALISLDRRDSTVPGWTPLKGQGRLQHAAETCATAARQT